MDQNQFTPAPNPGAEPSQPVQPTPNQPAQPTSPVPPYQPPHTVPPGAGLHDGVNYAENLPAPQPVPGLTTPPPGQAPPPIPGGNPAQTTGQKLEKQKKLLIASLVVIGILFILVIVFGVRAFINSGTLDKYFAAGKEKGKQEQLDADREKIKDISENPYRVYKAPDWAGAFELSFPKNWNISVTPSSNNDELAGLSNPDFVDMKLDKYAMRFNIQKVKFAETQKKYDKIVQDSKGKVKSEEIVVSDIHGFRYTGRINKKDDKDKTIVILPVRDKSLTLLTDNNEVYLADFNKVLSQAKIYP